MSKSQRRPQQIFIIVMWLVSFIFAGFLTGLGGLVIRDLPKADAYIDLEQFADQAALQSLDQKMAVMQKNITPLRRNVEDARQFKQSRQDDYMAARASFDNWILTRNATQSSDQNQEVLSRTREVEALKVREREAGVSLDKAQAVVRTAERAISDQSSSRSRLINDARPKFRAAKRAQDLKVFLYRLALTLPLLLAAGWMAKTKRKSQYWPLYRGFILFALFAFFVELVPYLPSYGGYVRYTVGVVLVFFTSFFIIRAMRQYVDRKQKEETRSEPERRQSIDYETALKKIAAKTCPGCDRAIIKNEEVNTDFCVHCGIRLQKDCTSCGTRNVSFHKFCLCCGHPSPEASDVTPQTPSTQRPDTIVPPPASA